MRWHIYFGANRDPWCCRDAKIKEWYRRIKKRRGSKIARVAVMRRLAPSSGAWGNAKSLIDLAAASVQANAFKRPRSFQIGMRFLRKCQAFQGKKKEKGCPSMETKAAVRP